MDRLIEQQSWLLTTQPDHQEETFMMLVILPSNSSSDYYPNNTLTQFSTHLPDPITLEGQWEVGLAEIQYPKSWYNIDTGEGWIRLQPRGAHGSTQLVLPAGQYDTPQQLIGSLNKVIQKVVKNTKIAAEFTYHDITKKTTVKVSPGAVIELSPTLTVMLGMSQSRMYRGSHEGVRVVDINQGFYSLYVYCDVVEPRCVGDRKVPLLRIVPTHGPTGEMITQSYENIQYIPILKKHFNTIEINIRKDTGEKVPFEFGKVVVTLHFRKRRPQF